MSKINTLFHTSFRWNTLETVVYQTLLVAHQGFLFGTMDHSLYGTIGTLFSAIYLSITLLNLGFDHTLGAFLPLYVADKNFFRKLFGTQLAINGIISTVGAPIVFFAMATATGLISAFSWTNFVIFCSLVIFEGYKKTLKNLLQLLFLNHKTTSLEVAGICCYITTVWSLFSIYHEFSTMIIFLPMIIVSFVQCLVFGLYVYQYFRELPIAETPTPNCYVWRIVKQRFFGWLNALSALIFSGNVIVPLFAARYGLEYAAVIKLTSYIAYYIHTILHKMFGVTIEACLAHIKAEAEKQRYIFSVATGRLHQILYGILLFVLINHKKLLYLQGLNSLNAPWAVANLFLLMNIAENFLIAYERLYATQEKSNYLLVFNLLTLLPLYGIAHSFNSVPAPLLLILMILIRVVVYFAISACSYYLWRVQPSWKIQPHYFVPSIIGSIAFFLLVN